MQGLSERQEVLFVLIACTTLAALLIFYLRHAMRCGKVFSLKRYNGPFFHDRTDNPFQYWMAMMFLGCFVLPFLIITAVVFAVKLSSPVEVDTLHQNIPANISR